MIEEYETITSSRIPILEVQENIKEGFISESDLWRE